MGSLNVTPRSMSRRPTRRNIVATVHEGSADQFGYSMDFIEAVREGNFEVVRGLLMSDRSLALCRWMGRDGDGRMRSLGCAPFNKHTWHHVPADCAPDD